jgi:TolB protein
MQIFVRQVGGGRVIALTSDAERTHRWPRWSPDGSRIAYQTDEGIEVVPALGGQSQSIVRLPTATGETFTTAFSRIGGFAWSPDGGRIAYTGTGGITTAAEIAGNETGLLIAAVDGGEPTGLKTAVVEDSAAWAGLHSPAWSADGSRLAVVSDNPIFVFGGVYFGNEGASSIWIVPVDGSAPVRVTDDAHLNMSPQWGPEDRYLYWVSDRGGGRDVYRARVGRDGRLTGDPFRVTTGADAHTITLSPDGTRLAYASFRTHSNIWSLPVPRSGTVSSEALRAVTSGAQTIESLDVTGDGEWLVFDSDRSGNSEIYVMPVAGGEPRQLTNEPAGDYSPAWSPDGDRIAFHSLRHGTRDVFTMQADGSGLTRHTEGPSHQLDPNWAPDGVALVFEDLSWDFALGHFTMLPLAGGEPQTLDVLGDFARWSPTGDAIAFHSTDGLHVIAPQGGESRLIAPVTDEFGEPFYAAWAPVGRRLYYVAKGTRGSSIHVVTLATGRSELVARFDDPSRQHTRYGFATDGRTFYLTMGSHESDVWVAEMAARP